MMRWLKRIALGLLALVVLVVGAGATVEAIARHRARSAFPPPGRMIDVGGRRIHLDCRGRGAPTVVFEAGLDTLGSLAWSRVHGRVAAVTRACAYDRAGMMWSDPQPGSKDAGAAAIAHDLKAALAGAGEDGPVVVVGHSLGGAYALEEAHALGDRVCGLVLVDASHPDQNARLRAAGYGKLAQSPPAAVALLSRLTWAGWTRLGPAQEQVPNLPGRAAAAANAYASTSMAAAIDEAQAIDRSFAQAGAHRALGDRPLVVLTGTEPLPAAALKAYGLTAGDAVAIQAIWSGLHDDEARWSTRGRQVRVPGAGHYIQLDQPQAVVSAVRDAVSGCRASDVRATRER
jgi:pimeloyl-ACP methyl ester carboxylesterase